MRKRKQTQFSLSEETSRKIESIINMKKDLVDSKVNRSSVVEKAVDMLYDFLIKNSELG